MIKCENGKTEMKGQGKTLLSDYMCITQAMEEAMGEPMAKEILPAAVEFVLNGMMGEPEIIDKVVSDGAVS